MFTRKLASANPDIPSDSMIGVAARHSVNNTTIVGSVATYFAGNPVDTCATTATVSQDGQVYLPMRFVIRSSQFSPYQHGQSSLA